MSKIKKNLQNETGSQGDANEGVSIAVRLFGYLLILILIAFSYSTSFSGVFVRDGIVEILENPNVHTLDSPWKTMFEGKILPARPIPYLTFAFNYAMHGEEIWGYHFVNLMIHIGSSFFLFGIVSRSLLLPSMENKYSRKTAFYLSWIITMLWALHPILTEAMNYIYQRMELLVSFFYLGTIYTFIRAKTSQRGSFVWSVLCVMCCSLGMLSKEIMVSAPIVLLWYDRVFLKSSWNEFLSYKSLIHVPLFLTWGIVVFLVQFQNEKWSGVFGGDQPAAWNYLMTQAEVIPYYIRLLIIPYPLCFEYGWPIQDDFSKVILPGSFVIFLLLLTIWATIKYPKFGFLAGCFFLILAPTSTIKPIYQPATEYRLYLVAAVFVALFVLLAFHLSGNYRRKFATKNNSELAVALSLAVVVVLVVFSFTTRERNRVYSSIHSLWEDTAIKAPSNPVPFLELGVLHSQKQSLRKAEEYLKIALRLDPNDSGILKQLGQIEMHLGKNDAAITHLEKALKDKSLSSDSKVLFFLGICHLNNGEFSKAAKYFQKASDIIPESPLYVSLHAAALGKNPEFREEAERKFKQAIELNPSFAKSYFSFAIFLFETKRYEEAIQQVKMCLQVDPNFGPARGLYNAILQKMNSTKQ